CEFLDGCVVERNGGTTDHGGAITEVIGFFALHEREWRTFVFPILRIQMSPTRIRVPDVCVYLNKEPEEQVPRTPPFLAVEILSPEDSASGLLEKLEDYRKFGVPFVWLIDPRRRWGVTHSLTAPVRDGLYTSNPDFHLPLEQLFED